MERSAGMQNEISEARHRNGAGSALFAAIIDAYRTPAAFNARMASFKVRLPDIGNVNVPGIFPVNRHGDNGAAQNRLNAQTRHKLVVASRYPMTVRRSDHVVAADLLNIGHPTAVD